MPESNFATEVATAKRASKPMPAPAAALPAGTAPVNKELAPQAAEPSKSEKPPQHGDKFVEPVLDFNAGMPADKTAVSTEASNAASPPAAPTTPAQVAKLKIKIGTKEFETPEAALEYAKELESGRVSDQAFIEGVKAAEKAAATKPVEDPNKPKEKTAYEQFADDVFQDPVKAAKEFADRLKNEMWDEYKKTTAQDNQIRAQQQRQNEAWENFFKDNPDLSDPDTRDIVKGHVYTKHFNDLKNLPPEEGLPKLAEYARKALKITREAALPRAELPAGPVTTTSATSTGEVTTTTEKADPGLDFVSALNQFRKRGKKS